MSGKLRPISGREVIGKLQRAGFQVVKTKGSAVYLHHPGTGGYTSVHVHGSKDIPAGTLRAIVRQAKLSVDEFSRL